MMITLWYKGQDGVLMLHKLLVRKPLGQEWLMWTKLVLERHSRRVWVQYPSLKSDMVQPVLMKCRLAIPEGLNPKFLGVDTKPLHK